MIPIAILGHGVVGSGVAEICLKNAAGIAAKAGDGIAVRRILDLRTFPDLPYADLFTADFEDIRRDDGIRIVVETMGGLHPAYEFVKASLEAGKSVVTSNKELVATAGDELLTVAREHNANFLFEASVGGGIPLLRPMDQCLAANVITEVSGILNGTTNFMLTKMFRERMTFDGALALAQSLGYAERDPAADVEGLDACRKISILASLAFGRHVRPETVHTEGITDIAGTDVAYAAAAGGAIRLIGHTARAADDRIYCAVFPMIVPADNLLAGVEDVFNAVLVHGDSVDDVVFVGRGAGKLPTASAVVADVIDAARHLTERKPLWWAPPVPDYVADYREEPWEYLLRFSWEDGTDAAAEVARVFGPARIVTLPDAPAREAAFLVPRMPEREIDAKTAQLAGMTLRRKWRVYSRA